MQTIWRPQSPKPVRALNTAAGMVVRADIVGHLADMVLRASMRVLRVDTVVLMAAVPVVSIRWKSLKRRTPTKMANWSEMKFRITCASGLTT